MEELKLQMNSAGFILERSEGDPLSTAASLVTLLDIATKALSYLREVKDSPKECRRLILELSLIRGVLQSLKESLQEQYSSKWSSTILSLSDDAGPLHQLSEVVNDLRLHFEKQRHGGLDAVTRALKWTFEKKAAEALFARLERQKTLLTLALSNDNVTLAREIRGDTQAILENMTHICTKMTQEDQKQADKSTKELLEWLSIQDYKAAQLDVFATRQNTTGTWLLGTAEFKRWLEAPCGVLFCKGMPGSGKTVLTSVIVDHLQRRNDVQTLYIYCGRHAATGLGRPDITELLGSLMRQLLEIEENPDLDPVKDLRSQYRQRNRSAMVTDFTTLLAQRIASQSKVFILIDGLDECEEETREQLLQTMQGLEPRPSLFLTSRDMTNDESELENQEFVEIHAQPQDIACYVKARIQSSKSLRKHLDTDPELTEKISDSITETAKGMFLMAKLHVDLLERKAKRAKWALVQAISALPEGLDPTYDAALDRIDTQPGEDKELGHRVLLWVHYTPQPLSMQQLQTALTVELGNHRIDEDQIDTPEYILVKCGGLVEADRISTTVRFVHSTVHDYFERNPQRLAQPASYLTRICLTYLSSDNFKALEPQVPDNDALNRIYSSYHSSPQADFNDPNEDVAMVHSHIYNFRRLNSFAAYVVDVFASLVVEDQSAETEEDLQVLFTDSVSLYIYHDIRQWFSFYLRLGQPLPTTRDPLMLALELEIPHTACRLLAKAHDQVAVDVLDSAPQAASSSDEPTPIVKDLGSAFHYAVFRHRLTSVRYLLDQGANVNSASKPLRLSDTGRVTRDHTSLFDDELWLTPLCQAVWQRDEIMVGILLESGALLNIQHLNACVLESPLLTAVRQQNLSMIKLLLERGATVTGQDAQGNTITHLAVQEKATSSLEMLLQSGAPIDSQNDKGESALYLAVLSKQAEAVSILVRSGARPKTLLDHSAEQVERLGMFRSLLSHGTDEDLAVLFQQFSETSISVYSGCILGQFRELIATGLLGRNQDKAGIFEYINHQLARFSMWAANIGAFAKGHASLDARLREKPEIQSLISERLGVLQAYLDDAYALATGARTDGVDLPDSDSDTMSSRSDKNPQTEFQQLSENLEKCMDVLYRLSSRVRKPRRQPLPQTLEYMIRDENGNDVDAEFSNFAKQFVKFKFPEANQSLQQRVSTSIIHKKKLFQYRSETNALFKPSILLGKQVKEDSYTDHIKWTKVSAGPSQHHQHEASTVTLADQSVPRTSPIIVEDQSTGRLDHQDFETFLDAVSVTTTRTTASGFSERVAEIPPPPNVPFGSKEVECPYCFSMLLTKDLSGSRWKTHFLRDVEPYFCLFQECTEMHLEFGERQGWINHLRKQHSPKIWQCRICFDGREFDDGDDYIVHLKQEHASNHLKDEQISRLKGIAVRLGTVYTSCPLCGFLDEKPDITMLNHIAGHLEVISLISLPYPKEEEKEENLRTFSLPTPDRSVLSSKLSWGSEEKAWSETSEPRRAEEWGFTWQIPYEIQEEDPILRGFFKRRATAGLDITNPV